MAREETPDTRNESHLGGYSEGLDVGKKEKGGDVDYQGGLIVAVKEAPNSERTFLLRQCQCLAA